MRTCVAAASTAAAPILGSGEYALTLRADGSIEKITLTVGVGSPPTLGACLERAVAGVAFEAGTPPIVYDLAFDWRLTSVKLKEAGVTVTGRLPKEVIVRIVRASFPRLRACYDALRAADPLAEGSVATSFVIDEKGDVSAAKADAGTLGDPTMRACVQKVFAGMSFPEPDGGKVDVSYPLAFAYD